MNSKIELKKGILIALEGIDGAGKTTQTKILQDALSKCGYSVSNFKEPTTGTWGLKIRDIARNGRDHVQLDDELNYFLLDREEDVEKNIMPSLENNQIVIMDRYYFSNIAYQGALGIDPEYIKKKNEVFPNPDLVIILDIAPETGIFRIENQRKEKPNEFEELNYLVHVRALFNKMDFANIQMIDGTHPIDKISKQILDIALDIIKPKIK